MKCPFKLLQSDNLLVVFKRAECHEVTFELNYIFSVTFHWTHITEGNKRPPAVDEEFKVKKKKK